MKCIFIYNPKSGKGKVEAKLDYIINTLKEKYDVVDIYRSETVDKLQEVVKSACYDYDAIIFAGGDGTFNNITCAISSLDKRPTLGYIPTGTANDIARNLSISRNIKKALKNIIDGAIMKHDVGKVNDMYFMYVVTVGACTATSYTTKHQVKKILGRLAYLKNGLDEFLKKPVNDLKFTSPKTSIEMTSPLILIMNSKSVGGISFNKYGHLNDGTFDIIIIKDDKLKGRFNLVLTFLAGLFGRRLKKTAITLKESSFSVEVNDNLVWCVDGESGPSGNISIENLRGHIEIFVPKRKIKRNIKKESKKNVK